MKTIKQYIDECGATPITTIGMGNPAPPAETQPGSEPLPTAKVKRKKKKVEESLLDNSLEDNPVFEIYEYLLEHSGVRIKKEKSYQEQLFNAIVVNSDGTFDMIGGKQFNFVLDEELPDYIKFNNVDCRLKFTIKSKNFITKGFPKKSERQIDLSLHCDNFKWLDGTMTNVDAMCIWFLGTDSAILNKKANIEYLHLSIGGGRSIPDIYDIPTNTHQLIIDNSIVTRMLKMNNIVSWSTSLSIE